MSKNPFTKSESRTNDRVAKYRKRYHIPEAALVAVGTGGYIAFDGQFITLQRVGVGLMSTGKGVKRIPLQSVTAVQIKPAGALINGFLQLTIPGGNEVRSQFGNQTFSAVTDENSIIFNTWEQLAFLKFRDAIEAAMVSMSTPTIASPDVMTQLKRLGELRDSGVVTSSEFEAKKTEMLGRI